MMNHMVSFFGGTFNKKCVTTATGLNLKYSRENYRDNFQINPKYEHPPMVPNKEWKDLMDYAKDKDIEKTRKNLATRFKKV